MEEAKFADCPQRGWFDIFSALLESNVGLREAHMPHKSAHPVLKD